MRRISPIPLLLGGRNKTPAAIAAKCKEDDVHGKLASSAIHKLSSSSLSMKRNIYDDRDDTIHEDNVM